MIQTTISNEIAAALIADKCRTDDDFMRLMQKDSTEALASFLGVSASGIKVDVLTVQNTTDIVHVVLPYYDGLEEAVAQSGRKLNDEDLAKISGGEIFVTDIIREAATISKAIGGTVTAVTAALRLRDPVEGRDLQ